jgi:hypothetical protein
MLEAVAKKIERLLAEKKLEGETLGTLDLLEPIDGTDEYRLIDYKTFGSYAVAKLLNLKDEGEYDRRKLALQLNNYRLLVRGYGFNVKELKCQITVRDGNTFSARNNKIDKNLYMIRLCSKTPLFESLMEQVAILFQKCYGGVLQQAYQISHWRSIK